MPIIEGADLTNVTTEFPLLPEGSYLFTVTGSEMTEDNSAVIIHRRVEETPDNEDAQKFLGTDNRDYINLVDKDGKTSEMGLRTIKQYLVAVFGKDSPESNVADTDPLHGNAVRIYIVQKGSKANPDRLFNNNKRFLEV